MANKLSYKNRTAHAYDEIELSNCPFAEDEAVVQAFDEIKDIERAFTLKEWRQHKWGKKFCPTVVHQTRNPEELRAIMNILNLHYEAIGNKWAGKPFNPKFILEPSEVDAFHVQAGRLQQKTWCVPYPGGEPITEGDGWRAVF